jgi:hypothetical protein
MRDIKDLTTEEITALVNESFDFHKIDSEYRDMGDVLYAIAANCELAIRECPECLDTDVEKANFKYLRNILETCANMMLDCDEYSR